jgi:RNA polymerase sigma-70 factor (ECF subfamily)
MFVKMLLYARSVLGNEALAEEAVQDTFRIACGKPEDLCHSPNPEGWLMNTLKNVLRNMLRSQARSARMIAALTPDSDAASIEVPDLKLLYGSLAETEEFRLVQAVAEGVPILEIAREWGISLEACKKRIRRAKEHLQKKI